MIRNHRRLKIKYFILLISVFLFFNACEIRKKGEVISKQEYGSDWPYSIESGRLYCDGPGSNVVLESEGNIYALNGRAMGNVKKRGYLDSRKTIKLWKVYSTSGTSEQYKDKTFVGRPAFVADQDDLYTVPMSDPGIIKRGLDMCK